MATIKTFRELLVWQKAHQLVIQVYQITKSFPREEQYILVYQIRLVSKYYHSGQSGFFF